MIKTEADRKDQWERLAWRESARSGRPYDEAMLVVSMRALTIYIYRLSDALVDEVRREFNGEVVQDSRWKRMMAQYPYENENRSELL
jgi:hypothetical protein